jgi:hypothetical protein
MLQRREDPMSPQGEVRDVYGYLDDRYIYKFEADSINNEIKVTEAIKLPELGIFLMKQGTIDVGKYHFVVNSGAECNARRN